MRHSEDFSHFGVSHCTHGRIIDRATFDLATNTNTCVIQLKRMNPTQMKCLNISFHRSFCCNSVNLLALFIWKFDRIQKSQMNFYSFALNWIHFWFTKLFHVANTNKCWMPCIRFESIFEGFGGKKAQKGIIANSFDFMHVLSHTCILHREMHNKDHPRFNLFCCFSRSVLFFLLLLLVLSKAPRIFVCIAFSVHSVLLIHYSESKD